MANSKARSLRILGLDLGTGSVGWAVLEADATKGVLAPRKLLGCGSRVFEAGLTNMEKDGKGVPRNADRRAARQRRRQTARRRYRLGNLYLRLMRAGLLPPLPAGESPFDGAARHAALSRHDADLAREWLPDGASHRECQLMPYRIRAAAAASALPPWTVGRALHHLAQRRGFESNRRTERSEDDEAGEVAEQIQSLASEIAASGARTLGAYLASVDPDEARVRGRRTSRAMYKAEFECIWSVQAAAAPDLYTDERKRELYRAIFRQRPLKPTKHLIGECDLERGRRRAPISLFVCQRFRLLQRLNDLTIRYPEDRPLSESERATVLRILEGKGKVTFKELRKRLKLGADHLFSHETDGEDALRGDTTTERLSKVFGDAWSSLGPADRERLLDDVRSIRRSDVLARRATRVWGLDAERAEALARVRLEEGYLALSRQAVAKLLPFLERGVALQTAIQSVYGLAPTAAPLDLLPPVDRAPCVANLRNPLVSRTLGEMRRVVNAVIRTYGKPDVIRIELARELKKSAKQRADLMRRNREQRDAREDAARRIIEEAGISQPSRRDVERLLLAIESDWTCPYSGERYGMSALFASDARFEVDHIVPFSRSLDDGYMNKVVCRADVNREKGNRTPFEAFGNSAQWPTLLKDAARLPPEKFKRFRMTSADVEALLADFDRRQLTDTAYAERKAVEYAALLFGGRNVGGEQRVQVRSGGVTALLRNSWELNSILNDGGTKTRDDHRHHAVDAVVVAAADASAVKLISFIAQRAEREGERWYRMVDPPWRDFRRDVESSVARILVSHRVGRRVRGALHEETMFGLLRGGRDGDEQEVVVRRAVADLTSKEVAGDAVVDPRVRSAVQAAFGGEALPRLAARDRPEGVPVRKARVRRSVRVTEIGSGPDVRLAKSGSNHHLEVVEEVNSAGGAVRWLGRAVTMYAAHNRMRAGLPVVDRNVGPNQRFRMTLAEGEVIELDGGPGEPRALFRIRTAFVLSTGRVVVKYARLNDARTKEGMERAGCLFAKSIQQLFDLRCSKVSLDPLGRPSSAND